jgi:hypothetical protein
VTNFERVQVADLAAGRGDWLLLAGFVGLIALVMLFGPHRVQLADQCTVNVVEPIAEVSE